MSDLVVGNRVRVRAGGLEGRVGTVVWVSTDDDHVSVRVEPLADDKVLDTGPMQLAFRAHELRREAD